MRYLQVPAWISSHLALSGGWSDKTLIHQFLPYLPVISIPDKIWINLQPACSFPIANNDSDRLKFPVKKPALWCYVKTHQCNRSTDTPGATWSVSAWPSVENISMRIPRCPSLPILSIFSLHHHLVSSCPEMMMSCGWSNDEKWGALM